MELATKVALIVGAGAGLSASLARRFKNVGMRVALAARQPDKLDHLAKQIGAEVFACDASDATAVACLFQNVDQKLGEADVVVYNPSYKVRGPLTELDSQAVEKTIAVTAFGGFLVAQQSARRMLAKGSSAIFFTGA